MRIDFGSIRHLHVADGDGVSPGVLGGGISRWDPGTATLVSAPAHELSGEPSLVAAAREAAAERLLTGWDDVLAEASAAVGPPHRIVLTCGRTLTRSTGPLHRQDFARVRVVARLADGTAAWRAVTLPDPDVTDANRDALLAAVTAPFPERAARPATPAPTLTGRPVLLREEAACYLAHEMLGHLFEWSEANARRVDRLGELSPLITLTDDPAGPSYVSYTRDTEDTPVSEPTALVRDGQVLGFLRARRSGGRPTGHGRRQDYCFPPLTRMAALRMHPGSGVTEASMVVNEVVQGRMYAERGLAELDALSTAGAVRLTFRLDQVLTDGLLGVGTTTTTSVHSCGKDGQEVNVVITAPDLLVLGNARPL
ncbi:metallopeptidase TldD-related protein [Nonomuraea sp. NPDC049725]|uniref:metallopeptidase TldD-related protein n=1 Tax=Nonomuraea sp. NPDC049725 TaxID=3154508 RepID=UPI00344A0867